MPTSGLFSCKAVVKALHTATSDGKPNLLKTMGEVCFLRRSFKFELMWTRDVRSYKEWSVLPEDNHFFIVQLRACSGILVVLGWCFYSGMDPNLRIVTLIL